MPATAPLSGPPTKRKVRLAYLVSHPIQYQAPLLRRIAQEPDIDLTVFFGSDFSTRGYKDEGFGTEVAWDTPLTEGYRHEFLPAVLPGRKANGTVSATTPWSRGIYRRLRGPNGLAAFDALWVHGYASLNALQGILAANALGIPVLLRAESWLHDRPRSTLKLALKHMLLHDLAGFIAATLPIGTLNARYWRHYFGPAMPQFLMPYAVDNAFFRQHALAGVPLTPTLRKILNLKPNRPVILFASKLQQRKHADHLIQAYAALLKSWSQKSEGAGGFSPLNEAQKEKGFSPGENEPAPCSLLPVPCSPPPHLVIVGEGDQRRHLEALTNQLGLDEDIAFAGFQNQTELPRFFALADVFVLPSRHEPWGLIVNEAMAAGCAVIVSTDVGAHADLVTDGVEGATFPAGNIPALTAALQRVFATPETPKQMAACGLERISTWSFDQNIQGLRTAIAQITRNLNP